MSELRARKGPRTLLGLLAALGLVAALAMPVVAGVDWATVTGYAEGTPENNSPDTWGDNCEDVGVSGQDTWVLPDLPEGEVYDLVIVKTASEQSAPGHVNTLFDNPTEGQTVWADSDGSGDFSDGDKGISHLIVCTADEQVEESEAPASEAPESEAPASEAPESEAPASEPAASERGGELGGTPTPAPSAGELPDTAIGDFGQTPATVLSLVLIAALAGMVYVRLARQR